MPRQSQAESVAEVVRWWEDAVKFYQSYHDRIGREIEFTINQQHYQDDNDSDPQRIKPADPALLNLIRHKAAQILKASEYYEVRPVDNAGDPMAAEQGKALLDQQTENPESEFQDSLEDVVDGALAASMWALEVGFDPDCGLDGELTFEALDPRRLFWTPGFKSPHSRRCPWIIIEKDMLPAEIERMKDYGWKNTSDVPTDSMAMSAPGVSAGPIRSGNGTGVESEKSFTKVLFVYERFVKDTKESKSYRALEPGEEHSWCPACDYKSLPAKYGPMEEGPCPMCGQPMVPRTVEPVSEEVMAYRKGKRLRIIAPHAVREFYNDRWPYDTRGFCAITYSPYNHPVNPIPFSDSYYYRSLACVSDAMLRLGYEQMRKAHGIILAPQDSLYDAYGEPFPFSEHRDIAYYDTDVLAPNAIQWFQPPGLNQAWSAYFQTIQGVFSANKGTGDLGLTQAQSKDIAVGTVRTLVETGEIPVDRHIRRFQRFRSLVLTRAFEIMRSTMTTERAVRVLGPNGQFTTQLIRASGLPGYDVVVTAEPTLAQMELDKAQALMQVAGQPPHVRRFLARALNIPASWMAEMEAIEAQMMQPPGQPGMQSPEPQAPNGNGGPVASPFAGAMSP